MSEIFVKFIKSDESEYLALRYPNAAALLQLIALRARREDGHPDGLRPGECFIGDWADSGMTQQEYRTAKDHLVKRGHILVIETNRTRKCKNSTTGATTVGTKVKIISTNVYDININVVNDHINDRATTEQRQTKKEQERTTTDDLFDDARGARIESIEGEPMDKLVIVKCYNKSGIKTVRESQILKELEPLGYGREAIRIAIDKMIEINPIIRDNAKITNYIKSILDKKFDNKKEEKRYGKETNKRPSQQDSLRKSRETFTESAIRAPC
jgi:hypothetical protein